MSAAFLVNLAPLNPNERVSLIVALLKSDSPDLRRTAERLRHRLVASPAWMARRASVDTRVAADAGISLATVTT
jgi:hypothetical protein